MVGLFSNIALKKHPGFGRCHGPAAVGQLPPSRRNFFRRALTSSLEGWEKLSNSNFAKLMFWIYVHVYHPFLKTMFNIDWTIRCKEGLATFFASMGQENLLSIWAQFFEIRGSSAEFWPARSRWCSAPGTGDASGWRARSARGLRRWRPVAVLPGGVLMVGQTSPKVVGKIG